MELEVEFFQDIFHFSHFEHKDFAVNCYFKHVFSLIHRKQFEFNCWFENEHLMIVSVEKFSLES